MSQINTCWAQVLGCKPICFAYRMNKDKMGKKWKLKKHLFQSSGFIFRTIHCFILKNKGLQYFETPGIIDHLS